MPLDTDLSSASRPPLKHAALPTKSTNMVEIITADGDFVNPY
jgi:hypothetical protein